MEIRHWPTTLSTALLLSLAATASLDRGASIRSRLPEVLVKPSSSAGQDQAAARLGRAYGRLPLRFEANVGQVGQVGNQDRGGAEDRAAARVKFVSRGAGYALFLTADSAVLALPPRGAREPRTPGRAPRIPAVLRLKLVGANRAARVKGEEELAGKSNYFSGRDPSGWRRNVPNFGKVRYEGVYRGIDLVYYGRGQELEYDFVVSPASNPGAIHLEIAGGGSALSSSQAGIPLRVEAQGDLVAETEWGEVRWHKPVLYQPTKPESGPKSGPESGPDSRADLRPDSRPNWRPEKVNGREPVDGRYVLQGNGEIGFELGRYDRRRTLVIDPVLSYSTYLGGSGFDAGAGIAVDSQGSAYVTGATLSQDFPVGNSTFYRGGLDAFVAKLDPAGSALVYSTYLGGSDDDAAAAIAVDSGGHAYLTGSTSSADFPTANAFQNHLGGESDAFVTKLSPAGDSLVYSTYLGGSFTDLGLGIALDSSGSAYITGSTFSVNFPTQNAFQPANGGGYDAFVTKLSPTGGALVYSTYLGGSADENNPFLTDVISAGIAVDRAGNAYVAGYTPSQDFPVRHALQPANHGFVNAFIAKLNPAGSDLVYATYLGGGGDDLAHAVALDEAGNAYVTGSATSIDFPVVNAFQAGLGGGLDAFVAKLSAGGAQLLYSTYLGGAGNDVGQGIAVDGAGNAFVTGTTGSADFPAAAAFQASKAGGTDAFVTKLNVLGAGLVYSTFLGGAGNEHGAAIALDSGDNAYVTGDTASPNFPTTGGAFDTNCGTDGHCNPTFGAPNSDAVVAKILPADSPGATLSSVSLVFAGQAVGSASAPQTLTARNTGSQPLVVRRILAAPGRSFTATDNCASPLALGASCTIRVTFHPTARGAIRGYLILLDNASPKPFQLARLTGNGT